MRWYAVGSWVIPTTLEASNEWANIDICKLICELMDELEPQNGKHEKLITFVKDPPGHDWRYAIDAKRMRDELNWRPSETFETGIRKAVEWYLKS